MRMIVVLKWIPFHYFRNKDSVPSQYLFLRFYLKLPFEELTKENISDRNWTRTHNLLLR